MLFVLNIFQSWRCICLLFYFSYVLHFVASPPPLKGLERLVVTNCATKMYREKIEKIALDLVKLENEKFSIPAVKLLVSCMYIGKLFYYYILFVRIERYENITCFFTFAAGWIISENMENCISVRQDDNIRFEASRCFKRNNNPIQ